MYHAVTRDTGRERRLSRGPCVVRTAPQWPLARSMRAERGNRAGAVVCPALADSPVPKELSMNTTAEPTPSDANATSCKTLVDTLVGLGSSWALHGLKIGKMAIMTSAETLGKTAETLETLAAVLQKKAADMKGE